MPALAERLVMDPRIYDVLPTQPVEEGHFDGPGTQINFLGGSSPKTRAHRLVRHWWRRRREVLVTVVTAGAARGKTRTLVARYLALIADDLSPSTVAAITLTR